jgi:hypothetical protein
MKGVLISLLFLLSSCAALQALFGPSALKYCGKVDTLEVYRQEYAFLSCKEVLDTVSAAYNILWKKGPGPLNQTWRIEYVHGSIAIDDPWAHINPDEHLIQVQEQEPRSILHELGHAYMSETHSGGRSQHRKMCDDVVWQRLERDFEVRPYCNLVPQ